LRGFAFNAKLIVAYLQLEAEHVRQGTVNGGVFSQLFQFQVNDGLCVYIFYNVYQFFVIEQQ